MKLIGILAVVLWTLAGASGCSSQSVGKSLGGAWVVHNSTTQTMIALGETEVVSVPVLKEFDAYQDPVLEGLNTATDDYLDGDEDTTQTEMLLDFIAPMLDRMLLLTKGNENE